MSIIVRLDVMLARHKMKSKELAELMGIQEAQLSKVKSGRMSGIKFETLDKLCEIFDCQPGELLEYISNN